MAVNFDDTLVNLFKQTGQYRNIRMCQLENNKQTLVVHLYNIHCIYELMIPGSRMVYHTLHGHTSQTMPFFIDPSMAKGGGYI